jgi:DNA-binding CsgD family transcriptional regulator
MVNRVARTEPRESSGKIAPSSTTLGELVRLLVNLGTSVTNGDSTALTRESGTERIVFDIELDGARYLLVRMPLAHPAAASLSPREQEIVRMVAKGHPNKIIADVLDISTWTVCTHLRRIFVKLGIGSRAAMVAHLLTADMIGDSALALKPPATTPSSAARIKRPA